MATSLPKFTTTWETENYIFQKTNYWPKSGKHILAQFDKETIVVYQAFKPEIAKFATEHQRFGGEHFSFDRMSWIKTNFLWMMYRCGWASKKDQERVLAVRITRDGFHHILSKAFSAELQKLSGIAKGNQHIEVRLQWDPDHSPSYGKMQRRAIQLGLKGEVLKRYGTEWIVSIQDVTDFVKAQNSILQEKGKEAISVAKERVYCIDELEIVARIGLDQWNSKDQCETEDTSEAEET